MKLTVHRNIKSASEFDIKSFRNTKQKADSTHIKNMKIHWEYL